MGIVKAGSCINLPYTYILIICIGLGSWYYWGHHSFWWDWKLLAPQSRGHTATFTSITTGREEQSASHRGSRSIRFFFVRPGASSSKNRVRIFIPFTNTSDTHIKWPKMYWTIHSVQVKLSRVGDWRLRRYHREYTQHRSNKLRPCWIGAGWRCGLEHLWGGRLDGNTNIHVLIDM